MLKRVWERLIAIVRGNAPTSGAPPESPTSESGQPLNEFDTWVLRECVRAGDPAVKIERRPEPPGNQSPGAYRPAQNNWILKCGDAQETTNWSKEYEGWMHALYDLQNLGLVTYVGPDEFMLTDAGTRLGMQLLERGT